MSDLEFSSSLINEEGGLGRVVGFGLGVGVGVSCSSSEIESTADLGTCCENRHEVFNVLSIV